MNAAAIITDSDRETAELGSRIARILRPSMVLALQGELGTGKTVLMRGIARGLGITEPVTSPTFTIVQEYRVPGRSGQAPVAWLFHLDMYRIESEDDALAFGIEEYLFVPDGVTVIEWPERIEGLLRRDAGAANAPVVAPIAPPPALTIRLEHVSEARRRLTLPVWLNAALGERP